MRILRIELKNLNSLYGEHVVDLAGELGDVPLFLIRGPTGSGKSTLMDAVALALFLRSLADELPPVPLDHPGGAVFEEHCEPCHGGEGLTGPPTPLGEVGTDPAVGASPDRTTGAYRTPSLRGVGDRRPLLSDGAVPDLPTLLSPDRDAPGHPYGQGLDADRRAALLDFLNAL